MDESTPEPTWVEWDPESEEFGAIANDRMTYQEQVARARRSKKRWPGSPAGKLTATASITGSTPKPFPVLGVLSTSGF